MLIPQFPIWSERLSRICFFIAFTGILISSVCAQSLRQEINCRLALSARMLEVKFEIPASNTAKVGFRISDWAGVNNYADNIYRVRAVGRRGRSLPVERTDDRMWSVVANRQPFTLSYEVVSQKENFMGGGSRNHFHPALFQNYAFLWGETFLLQPTDKEIRKLPVNLEITPGDYKVSYSNLAKRAESFEDFAELFLAAGNYRATRRTIAGRQVQFLIQGNDWKFTDEQFINAVSKIIGAQVKYMGFYPASKENLLITLNEGSPSSYGGTVVKNVISIYPNPQFDLSNPATLKLTAHEHFHVWNNDYLRDAGDRAEGYYKWLSEGFTDYYALLTLYREGIIEPKTYIEQLNEILSQYQRNPVALSATSQILAQNYWKTTNYNRLPYQKGAIIALLFDSMIRRKTSGVKNIDDFMRQLIEKSATRNRYADKEILETLNALTAGDNRRFYEDYVTGAKSLPVAETLKESGIIVKEVSIEVFDPGFVTSTGRIARGLIVKEVDKNSNAERAGMLTGDEIVNFSINFSDAQSEAAFTVRRGDKDIELKFYPSRTERLLQIDAQTILPK